MLFKTENEIGDDFCGSGAIGFLVEIGIESSGRIQEISII